MKIPFVDLKREAKLIKDELLTATEDVLNSGIYIMGEKLLAFEEGFAKYLGVKYAIGVGNGSDGLQLILNSLNLSKTDEVICPANSFIASAWSIVAAGAKPVFCDVNEDYLIQEKDIISKISKILL